MSAMGSHIFLVETQFISSFAANAQWVSREDWVNRGRGRGMGTFSH